MATGTVYGNVHTEESYTYGEKVYLNYTTSETGSTYTITCKAGVQAYTNAIKLSAPGTLIDSIYVSINDVTYENSTGNSGQRTTLSGPLTIAKGASKQVLTKTYTYNKSKTGTTTKTIYVASDIAWLFSASVWNEGYGINPKATTSNSSYKAQSFTIPKRTSYTITYNANGGTGAPAAGTKWADEAYTVSSTIPTRAGYVFDKWLISQTGAYVNAGGSISANSNNNYTLVAQWTPNTNTIQYDANGGTNAPASQTGTTGSTITLSSTVPTRIGYECVGWATSSTSSAMYSVGGNYTVGTAATQTLYAVWRSTYIAPAISNLTATRAVYENGVWKDDDSGTKLHVKFNYSQATEDGNTLPQTFKVGYKLTEDSTYAYLAVTGSNGIVDAYVADSSVILATGSMYDIQAVIEVGTQTGGPSHVSVTRNTYVAKAYFIIDINSDGTGIAFGIESSTEGFVSNMDTFFYKDAFIVIDENASSGTTDGDLYASIVGVGWSSVLS